MSEADYMTRQSPFAYQCHQCNRCCKHYSIKVNPYEVARLANHRGITTTEFIDEFTDQQGTVLKREANNACVFLGKDGCTVHPDRPLVCRLYPLGREDTQANGERFRRTDAVPGSLGVFATEAALERDDSPVVQDYLDSQDADPYIAAVDAYNRLLVLMLEKLTEVESDSESGGSSDSEVALPLMDIDAFLAAENIQAPADLQARMQAHIKGIEAWLAR